MSTRTTRGASAASTAPQEVLLRAVDLGVLAVTAAGGLATLLAVLVGTRSVAAGIAGGAVLATVFAWITRVAMIRATAGPAESIAVWVLVSYAVKGVLVLVALTLGAHDDDLSRTSYGLTLVLGVAISVALQAVVWQRRDVETVRPVATTHAGSFDDDTAVAEARLRAAGKVPPR